MKSKKRYLTLAALTVGLAAASIPLSAFARCPGTGHTTFYGSCAPRERCEKRVVQTTLVNPNSGPYGYTWIHYGRTNFGWYEMYRGQSPC